MWNITALSMLPRYHFQNEKNALRAAVVLTLQAADTLSKISNWSLHFYTSFESKIRLNKIHDSINIINKPKIYRDSAGHFV